MQVEGRSKTVAGRKWEKIEGKRGGDENSSEGERCRGEETEVKTKQIFLKLYLKKKDLAVGSTIRFRCIKPVSEQNLIKSLNKVFFLNYFFFSFLFSYPRLFVENDYLPCISNN